MVAGVAIESYIFDALLADADHGLEIKMAVALCGVGWNGILDKLVILAAHVRVPVEKGRLKKKKRSKLSTLSRDQVIA